MKAMHLFVVFFLFGFQVKAQEEFLLKLDKNASIQDVEVDFGKSNVKDLGFNNWVKVTVSKNRSFSNLQKFSQNIEKNKTFKIQLANYNNWSRSDTSPVKVDPDFPLTFPSSSGSDTEFNKQWGMIDLGVKDAWVNSSTQGENVVVAVIDSGVDYTHDELSENIWRNPGESGNGKETNGIDDDGNGFVDDVVGWDFAKNDNKPYDVKGGFMGNPGHGTHVSGIIAARADNGLGVLGVAPSVKVMAMRFITEQGSGTTDAAVQAIKYAVDNGAKILSNSWGSEGDDPEGQILKEAIQYALDKDVLFVAAAGNSAYDNDNPTKMAVPASYDFDNIISVAAIDRNNKLASFSNYGQSTVDIAAPGVDIYSTVPQNKYMTLPGTSMACPHVSGAAALYWSKYPNAKMSEVKNAVLSSAIPINSLKGKVLTGAKLNVTNLFTSP